MSHLVDGGGADDLGRQDQEGGRPSGKDKEKTFWREERDLKLRIKLSENI